MGDDFEFSAPPTTEASADPFAQDGPVAADPFAAVPAHPVADPFAEPAQAAADPFSAPVADADPFAAPVQQPDPFGAAPDSALAVADPQPVAEPEPAVPVPTEPSPLEVWEQQNNEQLRVKSEEVRKKLADLKTAGAADLQTLYEQRKKKLQNSKDDNRRQETEDISKLDALFKDGYLWDHVVDLIHVDQKSMPDRMKKLGRMRTLVIQLKHENPEKS